MTRGSSPLARGLRPPPRQLRGHVRIIPARAGFTTISYVLCESLGDHPRSRGVYRRRVRASAQVVGSSPLARGLREAEAARLAGLGIIPARAGFTGCLGAHRRRRWDHPRSRGVYESPTWTDLTLPGSSPLARGLPLPGDDVGALRRIIPARAGFTRADRLALRGHLDHPRSRGVYTCGSLVSQRTRSLSDPRRLHCRPRARSAGSP